jgi:hypothetical protein
MNVSNLDGSPVTCKATSIVKDAIGCDLFMRKGDIVDIKITGEA